MFSFSPIGYLRCDRNYHQEQPMQGVLSESEGFIELIKGHNYEQGLKDLDGFERIWVIYVFHHNSTWKPLTNPPYSDGAGKKGVFATRSPYRPNQIGLSCVNLVRISGNRLYVAGSDLLNNSPVLDIKPYIPEYDCFPGSRRGWLENVVKDPYVIKFSDEAAAKVDYLKARGVDLGGVIKTQLSHNPHDQTRNKYVTGESGLLLRFKSWRIEFEIFELTVTVKNIRSGYRDFSRPLGNDSGEDLAVHRSFQAEFDQVRPAGSV